MRRRVLGRGVVDDKILFFASVLAGVADRGWNGESIRLDAGVTATGYSAYPELKLTLC